MLACTQMRGQALSSTVPCKGSHLWKKDCCSIRCQYAADTPSIRSKHSFQELKCSQVLSSALKACTQMRGQVLSSTVPAHRMCQTLPIVFIFVDAGLDPDARSSALKYRACAQNVSDITHSFCIYGCWHAPRCGVKCSQVPCLRTECVRRYS